jgi:hypothetical protein
MKAKRSSSVQPKKARHMSDEAFADLKEALEGALAFERGERRDLHVTRIRAPRPPKVASPKVRRTFGA